MYTKVISTTLSVCALFLAALLPFSGLRTHAHKSVELLSSGIVSLFSCFSSGIFLGTCFLGLLPHLQKNEVLIRTRLNLTDEPGTLKSAVVDANFMVLAGLLLITVVEQVTVHYIARAAERKPGSAKFSVGGRAELRVEEATADQPLVALDDDSDDSADADFGRIEFRADPAHAAHGRADCHAAHLPDLPTDSLLRAAALVFALSTHSVFEGVALGAMQSDEAYVKFLVSIMLHEVLCSFAFGVKLAGQSVSRGVALTLIVLLSSSIPIGIGLMVFLDVFHATTSMLVKFVLEGFAAGIFIYVACIEMLARELADHRRTVLKSLAVAAGSLTFFTFNCIFRD